MLKTILLSVLAAIVVIAVGTSAYNVFADDQQQTTRQQAQIDQTAVNGAAGQAAHAQVAEPLEGAALSDNTPRATAGDQSAAARIAPSDPQGQAGQGSGGIRRGQSGVSGAGQRDTGMLQENTAALVTYTGTVSAYAAPQFTLLTAQGESLLVQLGNQKSLADLGLTLQDGDSVTVTGFIDENGALAVTSLTLDATGETFTFRSGSGGPPAWAGGRNK